MKNYNFIEKNEYSFNIRKPKKKKYSTIYIFKFFMT